MDTQRQGSVYQEKHNNGLRWVAEISIQGHRFKKKSTCRDKVEAWLNEMVKNQHSIEDELVEKYGKKKPRHLPKKIWKYPMPRARDIVLGKKYLIQKWMPDDNTAICVWRIGTTLPSKKYKVSTFDRQTKVHQKVKSFPTKALAEQEARVRYRQTMMRQLQENSSFKEKGLDALIEFAKNSPLCQELKKAEEYMPTTKLNEKRK